MTAIKAWMPIYWGDYLRDTAHLSAAEHGAYLLLIGHYWVTAKPLPDDDGKLRRIVRMDRQEWQEARETLSPFFMVGDGLWIHARIEAELVEWAKRKEAHSERASAAAKKRWEKHKQCHKDAESMPEALLEQCPSPSPSPDDSSLRSESIHDGEREHDLGRLKPKRQNGSRLPSGSLLPIEWEQWASSEGHRDPQREWKSFHDYWVGVPGQKGVKLDWEATWRNWVRRSLERNTPVRQSRPPHGSGTSFVTQAFDDLDESLFTRRGQ